MIHVIDIRHWLDEHDNPVPALRRKVLRIARLIESGGPLDLGHSRETLVECSRRVDRKACQGLLWVMKTGPTTIEASCMVCRREHMVITGWEHTIWADGPMDPLPPGDPPQRLMN